jgi:hypothetical protein
MPLYTVPTVPTVPYLFLVCKASIRKRYPWRTVNPATPWLFVLNHKVSTYTYFSYFSLG